MKVIEDMPSGPTPEAVPDEIIGFGAAEIAYLLAMGGSGSSAQRSRGLDLGPEFESDIGFASGVSSLAARGLAVKVDGEVIVGGAAAKLAEILSAASLWTTWSMSSEQRSDVAFVIGGDAGIVLLQPRHLATYWVSFTDDDVAVPDFAEAIVRSQVEFDPDVTIYIGAESLGASSNLLLRRAKGLWRMAEIEFDGAAAVEFEGGDVELSEGLRRFLDKINGASSK